MEAYIDVRDQGARSDNEVLRRISSLQKKETPTLHYVKAVLIAVPLYFKKHKSVFPFLPDDGDKPQMISLS